MGTESAAAAAPRRVYKYFDFVMAGFVTVLLCSSLIGVGKVCRIAGYSVGAGVFFFPVSYIFGDILTEVYGYARTRRVIWASFAALIFASVMSQAVIALPPAPDWPHQAAYALVYGSTPRIVAASLAAFWAGDFVNSFVLAKLKVKTEGRYLWLRTIGSTLAGQGVDSLVFYPLAFAGVWPTDTLLQVIAVQWALKVGWEALLTPATYAVVGALKRREGVDVFDYRTDFTPFRAGV